MALPLDSPRKSASVFHLSLPSLLVVPILAFCLSGLFVFPAAGASLPEQVEWTWCVKPAQTDARLPNVLLLGDSISRNYYPRVAERLKGVANVYLMATSASVGDPRLIAQIADFGRLESVSFAVVHFNNGMHGWGYSEEQYRSEFPRFLQAVRALGHGRAALIWASTTPVREDQSVGATNARIAQRNAIALDALRGRGVAVDDQHALMLPYPELYADAVHYGEGGSRLQGDRAAESIALQLKARR